MKYLFVCYFLSLILLCDVNCMYHHSFLRKRSKLSEDTSSQVENGPKHKETLKKRISQRGSILRERFNFSEETSTHLVSGREGNVTFKKQFELKEYTLGEKSKLSEENTTQLVPGSTDKENLIEKLTSKASTYKEKSKSLEDTSAQLVPQQGDKEALKEALQLLNLGKQTLGLNTEDPEILMKLANTSNKKLKPDQIQNFIQQYPNDQSSPVGKQYLVLSGENRQVHVDNFTNATSALEKMPFIYNRSDVRDIFRLVLQKKDPGRKEKALHKITIIETNQIKPYFNQEQKPFRRRRNNNWNWRKLHDTPQKRQKRNRNEPLLRYLRDKVSETVDESFVDTHVGTQDIRDAMDHDYIEDTSGKNASIREQNIYDIIDHEGKVDSEVMLREIKLAHGINHPYGFPYNGKEIMGRNLKTVSNMSSYMKIRTPLSVAWTGYPRLESQGDGDIGKMNEINYRGKEENINVSVLLKRDQKSSKFPESDSGGGNSKQSYVSEETSRGEMETEKSQSTTATTIESSTGDKNEKLDRSPAMIENRFALEKSLRGAYFPENHMNETKSISILNVAGIVFISLLCLATVLLIYRLSRWDVHQRNTLELKGVTLKVCEEEERPPKRSYAGVLYKTVHNNEEEVPDLEWQSEIGEWLSELDDKDSLQKAITFDDLIRDDDLPF